MRWYYVIDGKRLGPVAHEDFEQLIRNGTVVGETLVWRHGMDQWKTFTEVRERDPAMFATEMPPRLPINESPVALPIGEATPTEEPVTAPQGRVRRPMRIEVEETRRVAPEVPRYVGFWARGAALLVDVVPWLFVWQILTSIVAVWKFPGFVELAQRVEASGGGRHYQPTPEETVMILQFGGMALLVALVWSMIYDLIFLRAFSATPGKLLLGIRVVKANGKPLGVFRIVGRTLARIASGVPTFGIGFVVAAFDDEKRGLHDFLCGTRVVKKKLGE